MQAFDAYRVIDLTHILAGPFSTYQLAVLGADVIKIEPSGGRDLVRQMGTVTELDHDAMGTAYQTQAGNKRSMTLNLKSASGQALLKQLAASADVLVENYRTGALDALGLGYEALSAANPRLIYCSITGFGQTGPKARHTAYDNVIQAFSGLMAATGSDDTGPVKVGAAVLDYGTGAQAAFAIAAALLRRERSGKGQRLDVSMLDAALMLMSSSVFGVEANGARPPRSGNSHPTAYGYGCYPTASGDLMLGVHSARQHQRLWVALGRDDLAAATSNLTHFQLEERYSQDQPILALILLERSADEWEALLCEAGIPAARVRAMDEALAEPQLQGRQVLQSAQDFAGIRSGARVPVTATTWSEDGPALRIPPPRAGEHTDELLGELGYTAAEIAEFRLDGAI